MRIGRGWGALFAGPALLLVGLYLVYPTMNTIYLSFLDQRSEHFVGLDNYARILTSEATLSAFRNNLLWLAVFTVGTVVLGLMLAVLTDRIKYEAVAKSIIFMPMAISFAGAGVIWKFVYAYTPPGVNQIGLLNQIRAVFGSDPVAWLIARPWINNLALIAVGIWIWTGFAMVILSAAYKGIPRELMESARVDGANEWQVFRSISFPALAPTVAVVATTMMINVLKVFDIVYVMTNGNFGTEVLANRMYKEMFEFRNYGQASAIAVVLFLAIIPVMLVSIRRFREQEVH
ncbi:MAG: sugar ABC transporter permease [Firmicutes bacterium]|nr:sugar ABC transporter permease [Bacillota bacterium]